MRHPAFFPVEVNTASKEELLRVPGIGPKSVLRILAARRVQKLGMPELKRIGVVLKRAQYFITCNGRAPRQPGGDCKRAAGPQGVRWGVQQLSLDEFVPKALPDAAPAVHQLTAHGVGSGCGPHGARGGLDMPYPAHVSDAAYCYDGSYAGFLLYF